MSLTDVIAKEMNRLGYGLHEGHAHSIAIVVQRYLISKLGNDILAQLAQRDDWTPSSDLVFGTGTRQHGIDWLSYYSRMPSPGLVERRRSPVQLEQAAKGERTHVRYEYRITAAGKAALASGRY